MYAQDKELAAAVIKEDEQINQMEIAIKEYCLTILEQVRPVREDLHLVVAVLKINATLERVGDLAGNSVIRFDAATGPFLGDFFAEGSNGLFGPRGMIFDSNHELLLVNRT